jgi:hypothetical protein
MGVSPTLTARSFRCPLFSAYPSFYSASSLGRPSTLFPRSSSPQLSARQSLPACRHVESPMRIKFNWLPPRQRFSPVLYASRSGKAICLLFPKLFCIRYFHSTLHWHSFCPWPSLFSQGRISKKCYAVRTTHIYPLCGSQPRYNRPCSLVASLLAKPSYVLSSKCLHIHCRIGSRISAVSSPRFIERRQHKSITKQCTCGLEMI